MRIPTGSLAMACVLLSVALLLTGCAGAAVKEAQLGEEVFLQPAMEQGPDPFTESTAAVPTGSGVPRAVGTGRTADVSAPPAGLAVAPLAAAHALSGGTPGLYSGSVRVTVCDVERQIGRLTADPARGEAFARAAGVSRSALPGYLRALTPVLLRADTRVTNHGYRDGEAAGYQAVLQAGTAVLVDDRGLPRVRCACGNPLRPPEEARGGVGARGTAWSGYRPNQVIVVTPAPQAVSSLTLLDARTNSWIERQLGLDVAHDQLVAPPILANTAPPDPGLTGFPHPSRPDTGTPRAQQSRPGTAAGQVGGAVIGAGREAADRAPVTGTRADEPGHTRVRDGDRGARTGPRATEDRRDGERGAGDRDAGSRRAVAADAVDRRGGDRDAGERGAPGVDAVDRRGRDAGAGDRTAGGRGAAKPGAATPGATKPGAGEGHRNAPAADGHGTPTPTADGQGAAPAGERGTRDPGPRGIPTAVDRAVPAPDPTGAPTPTVAPPPGGAPTPTIAPSNGGAPTVEPTGASTPPGSPSASSARRTPPPAARALPPAPSASPSPSAAAPNTPAQPSPSATPSSVAPPPPSAPAPTPTQPLLDPFAHPPGLSLYDPPRTGALNVPQDLDGIAPPGAAGATGTPGPGDGTGRAPENTPGTGAVPDPAPSAPVDQTGR
ncbi:DUF6777 domain-containing protein [Streptomyces misionensis]|uniref:DUF6777 domain-containing protein n=1 Tax=Streptomyces misionensis TaxID=67331 RepID=UPI0033A52561